MSIDQASDMDGSKPRGGSSAALRCTIDAVTAVLLGVALLAVYFADQSHQSAAAPAVVPLTLPPPEQPDVPPEPPVVTLAELPAEPAPPDPQPPPVVPPGGSSTRPVDATQRIALLFSDNNAGRFGVSTTTGNPDDTTDDSKLLTFNAGGSTNNTRLFVDGAKPIVGSSDGQTLTQNKGVGSQFEFAWVFHDVVVRQTIAYVAGEVSGRVDAIQVDYRLENRGRRAHNVGLRVMIDSLIGGNDGVPFIVPGNEKIVTQPIAFHRDKVPDFIRALENANLVNPGVVCDLGLRPDEGQRPDEVRLTHWPGSDAEWDYDQHGPFGSDTAIGLYYSPRSLGVGKVRHIRFTYGLGSLSSTATKNPSLSLTAGGPFRAGGKFWLVALVNHPRAAQKVRVELPEGLSLDPAHAATKDVTASAGFSPLSWLIQIAPGLPAAKVSVRARLEPDGIEEHQEFLIQERETRLTLAATPPIFVGGAFWLAAVVQNPKGAPHVKVELPDGISLDKNHSAEKPLPTAGAGVSQVAWLLHVAPTVQPGPAQASVHVSPGGIVQRITLAIRPRRSRLVLKVPPGARAGKLLWVTAVVQNPQIGQAVHLRLPTGLELDAGQAARVAIDATRDLVQVNWRVKTAPRLSGRHRIEVSLSPGDLHEQGDVKIEGATLLDQ